ncbi:PQQ-like beta-propeller repeat protein [Streptomyces sp. WZ.A104]|uniref:PQQ-like beta-propeller repeat protein n=1 Tax=Streptomyces sp. WZ.A104 TaxID=2023771 RepID=UPI00211BD513|nr:PQQ-like beta-propeller repeat protein [Streptomyces sp. WZ.A104]
MPMPQAPGSGSGGRSRGRVAALVAAVLAGVLVVGAGVWFAAGDGGSTDDKKPVAKETTAKETAAPGESGPPGERSVTRAPTADDLNAQREPGDSRVLFVQKNEVDLPGGGTEVYGPWFAGDLVTRAAYRTVAGHAVADGTEEWSLPLATSVCAAPTLPTTDGKIVLALQSDTSEGATCDRLQMVDLATGKAGWSARFQRIGVWDGLSKVNMAVNGDVLTVGRVGRTDAFRISDGKHLWDELPGNCQPFGFASGPVPLAATSCQEEGPNDHAVQHVRRIDPATGRIQWSYKVKKGWKVDQFYSVDPPVVSLRQGREKWGILILGDDGTRRSALSGPAADNYAPTCGFQEADRGRNLDACQGVAADDDTFYIATEAVADGGDISNAVAAFALETGKQKWKVEAPARQILMPLRVEDGRLLMYVSPARAKEEGTGKGGGILALPSGGGDLEPVLRHPVAASTVERTFSPPLVAYSGGRAVLVQPLLSRADDEQEQEQVVMLGFGD